MSTKRDEIRDFIKREVRQSLLVVCSDLGNREHAESIRMNINHLSVQVAFHIAEEYRFLELADIMEWKRTRVRR